MKKLTLACLIAVLLGLGNIALAEENEAGPTVILPAETPVAVELVDAVTSKSTFVGETLMVNVLEDIVINNVVVIEKDSKGFITVVEVKKAGQYGKAGGIVVQPQYLKTANWIKVPLKGVVQSAGNGHAALKGELAGGAGKTWNPLQWGGFAGLLLFTDSSPGQDAAIPAGTKLIVTVSQNVDLKASASDLENAMTAEPKRRGQNSQASPAVNWTGQYISSRGKLSLTQAKGSNVVTGVYERGNGRLEGRIEGNRLIGKWYEDISAKAPSGKGDFEFVLSSDGLSVMMLWRQDYSSSWKQDSLAARLH